MKHTISSAVLFPLLLSSASAHISYTNRNFGTFDPSLGTSSQTLTSTVAGNYGWADATDSDFGDSHRLRAFRFTLSNAGYVNLSVQGLANANPLVNVLNPGFSIYSGLSFVAPAELAHDTAAASISYLNGLPGPAKEGAFRSLVDFTIGNTTDLITLYNAGHVADGTALNYGSALGINGDGSYDNFVTGTFYLPAGDYSVFIGGTDYSSQADANNRNLSTTLTVIPEPSTALLSGLAALALCIRRKRH